MKTMETTTKRNLIIWSIVILVILNITSLGTIWFHRYRFNAEKVARSPRDKMINHRSNNTADHRSRSTTFLTRNLDLSPLQKEAFDSIWQYYNVLRKDIEQQMEENRENMGMIMSSEELDTSAFYGLSALQAQHIANLDRSMLEMNIALRTTLNLKQRQLFIKRIEAINNRKFHKPVGREKKRKRVKQ